MEYYAGARTPDTFGVDDLVKKRVEREPLKNKRPGIKNKMDERTGGSGTAATYLHFAVPRGRGG